MKQVTIGTRTYSVRKLPAYPDQMLMAKAIMPVYADMIPIITRVLRDRELRAAVAAKKIPPEFIIEVMDTMVNSIRKLSNDDLLELTQRSLAAVQIQQGQAGWSNLMLPSGQLMFTDLELFEIIQLIQEAVGENLSGFFAASLGTFQGEGPKE